MKKENTIKILIIVILIILAIIAGVFIFLYKTTTVKNGGETSFKEKVADVFSGDTENAEGALTLKVTDDKIVPVSSEGMVAAGFDGPLTWSPDGKYLTFEMSNLTAGSAQIQVLSSENFKRLAIVDGYNASWERGDFIFTQHRYYDAPNYGSHEVMLKVSISKIVEKGSFSIEDEGEVIKDFGMSETPLKLDEDWPLKDNKEVLYAHYSPNDEYVAFIKKNDEHIFIVRKSEDLSKAFKLTEGERVNDYFAFSPDGNRLFYKSLSGEKDEFSNFNYFEDAVQYHTLTFEKGN